MFYLDAVHYEKDRWGNDFISEVKGTNFLNATATDRYSKQAIINYINNGNPVKTKYYRYNGWNVGEDVRVVDNAYLRTDANNIKADNLGSLPRY